jgi:hypothetical protein
VRTGAAATAVTDRPAGAEVCIVDGDRISAGHVLSTVPLPVLARIADPAPDPVVLAAAGQLHHALAMAADAVDALAQPRRQPRSGPLGRRARPLGQPRGGGLDQLTGLICPVRTVGRPVWTVPRCPVGAVRPRAVATFGSRWRALWRWPAPRPG